MFAFHFRFRFGLLSLCSLATKATYQASGVCPNLFCKNSKINSHFFLAKHASPTTTRDSRDSMPGKQSEKTLRPASISSEDRQESNARDCQVVLLTRYFSQGKTRERTRERNGQEGKERKERKERRGMETLKTYCLTLINISNKRDSFPLLRLLASLTNCSGKNRIITVV